MAKKSHREPDRFVTNNGKNLFILIIMYYKKNIGSQNPQKGQNPIQIYAHVIYNKNSRHLECLLMNIVETNIYI